MEVMEAKRIVKGLRSTAPCYNETAHCELVLQIISKNPRPTAFCKAAGISDRTFYKWLKNENFNEAYRIALCYARESWEEEYDNNKNNEDWDKKRWQEWGDRNLNLRANRISVQVNSECPPWEQYQQIMQQAQYGDFTASDIKQLMESVNVGKLAYESQKLQEQINAMEEDLLKMGLNNGNNIIPIKEAKK